MPMYSMRCLRCSWEGDKVIHFAAVPDTNHPTWAGDGMKEPVLEEAACHQVIIETPEGEVYTPKPQRTGQRVGEFVEGLGIVEVAEETVPRFTPADIGREVRGGSGRVLGHVRRCGGELERTEEVEHAKSTPYAWKP